MKMEYSKLQAEIRRLLKAKKAILLAHNYQPGEIQDIADLTGDSLALSVEAARTDAEIIVFCGVRFMAETAAILCPDKAVLLPRIDAGCEMADMIDAESLRTRKASIPEVPVVTYVNSTAEVKAESDICCTSANAVTVVNSLSQPTVLMAPDRNLAKYTQIHSSKKILLWEGYCPIHDRLQADDVLKVKKQHPGASLIVHPECRPEIVRLADAVRSTTGMLSYVGKSPSKEFIIATETGLLHTLRKQFPDRKFYPVSDEMVCPHMKLTRIEDIVTSLLEFRHLIKIPEETRVRAKQAIDKMLQVPRD